MTSSKPSNFFCCEELHQHLLDEDVPIIYNPQLREIGIPVKDGGTSIILISFCPWCGQVLPPSLRDEWLQKVQQLGLEPGDPAIPAKMRMDAWWRAPEE